MFIMKNLVFFLILLVEQSITNDDFDRLPKPPVNYRHFVEQVGQTYKILEFDYNRTCFDNSAIIKCSNIETNLFSYIEVCQAALNNSQSISFSSSISVIGFVSRPPVSFDLIIDPFFSSLSPLISIPAIHGKTPEHFFLHNKFMNCTGQLRLIDDRKLFIDTPSTYGFSGAPCVSSLNRNQWEFIDILTGASKLWNTCTSLPQSTIFNYYYNKIVLNTVEDNVYKNDL
ncbi:unnamed protein product [Rotaria sordida]|uniref:Uncharacterized protein n=1 Tax=Rotaria sordida TaxID=392033 RepID=A0A819I042_9BILA|nr:unnamed protein product [Rotaria sordida]